jgi:hypothetical protein
MNNFWTVKVNKDGKVFLENESYFDIKLVVEGAFANKDEEILFAANTARKINGTFSQ